jgi:hypothetical protein
MAFSRDFRRIKFSTCVPACFTRIDPGVERT